MKEIQDEMFPRVDPAHDYWSKLTPSPRLRSAAARATDPETSHEAAAEMLQEKSASTRLQHLVWSTLKRHPGGLTNHELVAATGIDWNTITPRVAPLVRKGLVIDSGGRRKGPTGKSCIVWKTI